MTDRKLVTLTERWYAKPNDLTGGWSIMTADVTPADAGEDVVEVGSFLDEALARHIVEMHNGAIPPVEATDDQVLEAVVVELKRFGPASAVALYLMADLPAGATIDAIPFVETLNRLVEEGKLRRIKRDRCSVLPCYHLP